MKTIAVTIDETTLQALDKLVIPPGRTRRNRRIRGNRSKVVRQALQEFIARREQEERERTEWKTWQQHIDRINQQAALLVAEQAEP